MIRCVICGGDIDAMGMDNVSPICGAPVCESCAENMTDDEWDYLRIGREALDRELATCDDCSRFDTCYNAVFQGRICGDYEKE